MQPKRSTPVFVIALAALGLIMTLYLVLVRPKYPYGRRTCALPCMYSTLGIYARHHGGWLPDSTNGVYEALTELYPEYTKGTELVGISGNRAHVLSALENGTSLAGLSSWEYHPGYRIDDDPNIAILWERVPGLHSSGEFTADWGHAVLFLSGEHKYISGDKWPEFLREQELRRKKVLASRSPTNPLKSSEMSNRVDRE